MQPAASPSSGPIPTHGSVTVLLPLSALALVWWANLRSGVAGPRSIATPPETPQGDGNAWKHGPGTVPPKAYPKGAVGSSCRGCSLRDAMPRPGRDGEVGGPKNGHHSGRQESAFRPNWATATGPQEVRCWSASIAGLILRGRKRGSRWSSDSCDTSLRAFSQTPLRVIERMHRLATLTVLTSLESKKVLFLLVLFLQPEMHVSQQKHKN